MVMLSRLYVNPKVRNEIVSPHKLQFLTTFAILQRKYRNHKVTLRDVLRLFRKELKREDIYWKQFFIEDIKNFTLNELFYSEIEKATSDSKWQAILSATNEVVEEVWHVLDQESKEIFLKYFQRIWLCNRSPIPLENAHQLLKLTEQKKLTSISGLNDIRYDYATQKYYSYC